MKISFIIFSIVFMVIMYVRIATEGVESKEIENNLLIKVTNWKKTSDGINVEITGSSDIPLKVLKLLKCELLTADKSSLGYVKSSIKSDLSRKPSKTNVLMKVSDINEVSYLDCNLI